MKAIASGLAGTHETRVQTNRIYSIYEVYPKSGMDIRTFVRKTCVICVVALQLLSFSMESTLSFRPFIMLDFFRFKNGPFLPLSVCNFIFELPCTSVASYARLHVKTSNSLLSYSAETTRTTYI